jgi:ketosteroid isomerase-like protein
MSQKNVEVVRQAFDAFMRRDNEAAFAAYDSEVELQHWVDGSLYRGLTGAQAFWGDWLRAWGEWSADLEELIDPGDEVIAVLHLRALGKQSGVPVERRECHVWTVRNGKLSRLRIYETKSGALEAAGVGE